MSAFHFACYYFRLPERPLQSSLLQALDEAYIELSYVEAVDVLAV